MSNPNNNALNTSIKRFISKTFRNYKMSTPVNEQPDDNVTDLGKGIYLVNGVRCTIGWVRDESDPDCQGFGFKPLPGQSHDDDDTLPLFTCGCCKDPTPAYNLGINEPHFKACLQCCQYAIESVYGGVNEQT